MKMNNFNLPPAMAFTGNVAENFKVFMQNLEIYMVASDKHEKPDKVKVAILLNCIGQEGINIFNTFELSADQRKKYDAVIAEFEKYCNPKKNVIYERFKFFKRCQEGEAANHFITELKKLASSCEFEGQMESLIRYRIVLGIRNSKLQERLLSKDLTLQKAIDECLVAEVAAQQMKELQSKSKAVEEVKSKKVVPGIFNCQRCLSTHGPR